MASTPSAITFTIPIAAPPSKNIANEKASTIVIPTIKYAKLANTYTMRIPIASKYSKNRFE